jgi:SpoVK/Ycf46/Vps4 family AAA+-type ATPase
VLGRQKVHTVIIAHISFPLFRVKAVFSLARRLSPCIIFLDEVDSLFGARSGRSSSGSQAYRQVLTGKYYLSGIPIAVAQESFTSRIHARDGRFKLRDGEQGEADRCDGCNQQTLRERTPPA